MLRRIRRVLLGLVLVAVSYFVLLFVYTWFTFTFWSVLPLGLLPSAPEAAIFLLFIGLPLYFLPAIIGRKKRNARALLALNVLAGWTFIGWVGALVWALLRDGPAGSQADQQS